jgi:hypothetical protein
MRQPHRGALARPVWQPIAVDRGRLSGERPGRRYRHLAGSRRVRREVGRDGLRDAGDGIGVGSVRDGQARLLKTLLSNCTFDRGTLCPTYTKPFDLLVVGNETGDWLGGRDLNPDNVVQSRPPPHRR